MKLPSYKRITKADYSPDQQPLVERLGYTLNGGLDSLFGALNNNVSLADNIACSVKDITIQVDATGKPTNTAGFPVGFPGKVSGLIVTRAINSTTSTTYPTGTPFISYIQSGNIVNISNITGLSARDTWQIRVVAFAE